MVDTCGYAGCCPRCGGWWLLISDVCGKREVAKEVAAIIRSGAEVRRITKGEGQAMKMCPIDCSGRKGNKDA